MHWTLEQVEQLDEDVYAELVRWLNDEAERLSTKADPEGSIDVDAVIEAKAFKDRAS